MENLSGNPQHGMKSEDIHISSNILTEGVVLPTMTARPPPNWPHNAQHGVPAQGLPPFPLLMLQSATSQMDVNSSSNMASIHRLPAHAEPGSSSIWPPDNDGFSWRKFGQQPIQTLDFSMKSVAPSWDGHVVVGTASNHNHPFQLERWPTDGPAGFELRSQDYVHLPGVSAAGTSAPRTRQGGLQLPSSSDSSDEEDEEEDEARLDVDVATNRMSQGIAPAPAQRIPAKTASEVHVLDGNLQPSTNNHQSLNPWLNASEN